MAQVVDLTTGKHYDILEQSNLNGLLSKGIRFFIIDDAGFELYCSEKECANLKGQNWEIQK